MLLSKVQRERLEEDTKFVLISGETTASDKGKLNSVENLGGMTGRNASSALTNLEPQM